MLDTVFGLAVVQAQHHVSVDDDLVFRVVSQFQDAAQAVYQYVASLFVVLDDVSQITALGGLVETVGRCLSSHVGHLYYLGSDSFGMMAFVLQLSEALTFSV